ncbi:hypothetical protein ALC56_11571 [Trachymyrmex septentrionalis]|uniref:Uncharacterized protein n=1 Tax=Trachymyrmex septentrionalis TaxID=34720 RepID=A0A195F113_9HYME|nr:hypothetical protein ALC56_11571 [Trachymyrmex septentrionalis]
MTFYLLVIGTLLKLQDINHVIFYCPITFPKSTKLTSFIDKTFSNTPRDIFSLLKKPVKMCRVVLTFFKATNLHI